MSSLSTGLIQKLASLCQVSVQKFSNSILVPLQEIVFIFPSFFGHANNAQVLHIAQKLLASKVEVEQNCRPLRMHLIDANVYHAFR